MNGQKRHQTAARVNVDVRESMWTAIRLQLDSLGSSK